MKIPELLVRQARSGNLVLFVGSGVSSNSTSKSGSRPATWRQLLDVIAEEFGVADDALYKSEVQASYLKGAEYLFDQAGRVQSSTIYDVVRRSLEEPEDGDFFQPNEWHDAIMSIGESGPRVIVTTNFDRILERALGAGYAPRLYHDQNLIDSLQDRLFPIYKLHGCISNPAKMIITEGDYLRFGREGHLILDLLRSLLMTRTALFIGYSFSDPDIRSCLNSIFGRFVGGNASHFILQSKGARDREKEMLLEHFGVNVIEYENTDGTHSAGLEFLRRLGDESVAHLHK